MSQYKPEHVQNQVVTLANFDLKPRNPEAITPTTKPRKGKVKNKAEPKAKGAKSARKQNGVMLARKRLEAIAKLIPYRHVGTITRDEALTYFRAALPNLALLARAKGEETSGAFGWVKKHIPHLAFDYAEAFFHEADTKAMADESYLPLSDEFATLLHIQAFEVKELKLRTVGAIDRLKPQRDMERKEANRVRMEKQRRVEGRPDRGTWRSQTKASRYPRLHGESNSSHYRRIKRLEKEEAEASCGNVCVQYSEAA
jgi:hypothetical protein